jgi:hypothetical protein
MRVAGSLLLSLLLAMIPACGGGSGTDGGADDGDGGGGDGDGGGDPEFTDALSPEACKHVDLVFSVDPSSSMAEEMVAMSLEIFPGFAGALLDIGDGLEDYRVGVIDACPWPANFHTRGETTGECNFQSGEVWMDSSSTALLDEFECVGDIYHASECTGDNDDEQPASAAAASLEPPTITTGANAGFLRDDALLVVIAITDEDEQPVPASDAQAVFNRLVATKGDVQRMVFLGIGGGTGGCAEGAYGSADEATLLRQITQLFIDAQRGVWWDLCAGNLEDGLTEAMEVIEQACDEFPPIG